MIETSQQAFIAAAEQQTASSPHPKKSCLEIRSSRAMQSVKFILLEIQRTKAIEVGQSGLVAEMLADGYSSGFFGGCAVTVQPPFPASFPFSPSLSLFLRSED